MASGCNPDLNYDQFTANGTQTNFVITFDYHDSEDIRARINNVEMDNTTYSINPGNPSEVIFNPAPPAGTLFIYRCTDLSSLSAVFNAGATIRAVDLNDNFEQLLLAIEDANNLRIQDIANAAVNLGYQPDIFDPADSPGIITNNKGSNAALPIVTQTRAGILSGADKIRLDGIEDNATRDQTAAEIRTLVESATDSNVFTDADHSKLDGIEANATQDQTAAEIRTLVGSATDSNVFTDADHTKLDGIETAATADQTGAEIKALYEVEANAFTDAQFTKLAGIETGATADQTGAEIKAAYEGEANTNAFTDADHTKLDGIEAGATADQTAAEIRTLVNSATDSNVFTDADHTKLDGIEAGATADQTKTDIDALNIDADTLDNQHGSYYQNASNLNAGTISDARIPDTITPDTLVVTKEIRTSNGTEVVINAGESSGKIANQTGELVYVNAEGGLRVCTPSVANWASGYAEMRTDITGKGIYFYRNTTRMGEITSIDTTFLRINQETNKNIYTPRYIRADGGFFVDGTAKGINGSGNFIGGTIAGASDYGTLLRSNVDDEYNNGKLTIRSNSINGHYWGAGLEYDGGWKHTNANSWGFVFRNSGGFLDIKSASEAGTAGGAATYKVFRIGGSSSLLQYDGNTVWHAGNDGSGSGLDADTVDGLHSDQARLRDARADGDITPTNSPNKIASFTFTDDITNSTRGWDSVLTMKGWEGSTYRAWQLIGNASTASETDTSLYFREGVGSTWGSLQKIWTSGNFTPDNYLRSNTTVTSTGFTAFNGGMNSYRPSNTWNGNWYGINGMGGLYTGGSYRTTIVSNGYRNSSNQWTTFNAGGITGASQIDLAPDGNIYFYGDSSKANGSSSQPSLRMRMHNTGVFEVYNSITLSGELNLVGSSDAHKYLDARVGSNIFYIRKTTGGDSNHENMAHFRGDGECALYHNASVKFQTSSYGAYSSGYIRADGGFLIDGTTYGIDGAAKVKSKGGSATDPGLSFGNDTNTGVYRINGDNLGFTAGGVQRGKLNGDTVTFKGVYNASVSGGTNVRVDTAGRLRRHSSSRKTKTNIEPMEVEYAYKILDQVEPIWYRPRIPNPNYPQAYLDSLENELPTIDSCSSYCLDNEIEWDQNDLWMNEGVNPNFSYWGFIAEDLAEIDPRLCSQNPETGEYDSVQYEEFTPLLLKIAQEQKAQIINLEQRLEALETKFTTYLDEEESN